MADKPNPLLGPYAASGDVITKAAEKYGVPVDILQGVYGVETDFGRNIATSSAGAMGAFQFMPPTARSYNYPLTNNPSPRQFQQQAEAAAHLLSDNYKRTGSWEGAINAYAGADKAHGGYGLKDVQDKLGAGKSDGLIDKAKGAVGDAVEPVKDALAVPAAFYNLVSDVKTWIRLFEAIAGIVLVYFGLTQLTGSNPIAKVGSLAR